MKILFFFLYRLIRILWSITCWSCCSVAKSCPTLWDPHGLQHARLPCPSLSPKVCSYSCPLTRWWFNHLIHCQPLLLLPSIFPIIRFLFNVSALYISSSNEYSGCISFKIDWFDLLAVQGTLRSLLQHHNSNASVLQHWAFFMAHTNVSTWLLEKP